MTIPSLFLAPGGDHEDDAAQSAVGRLTTEQNASFAPGLLDMEPVPAPSALKELTAAAAGHPSVVLDPETLQALFAGATHLDELLDQLDHPDAMAEQLDKARSGRGRRSPTKRRISRLGRLAKLSTDTGYAAVVSSPLHQVAGVKVLPVNPRFLAEIRHAFTKGHTTDPTIEGTTPGLLEIRLPGRRDLVDLITATVAHHLVDYDWSDSIARTGVQEPLTCMTMRVHYDDGASELVIVAIDGQSRLASAWRNILGIGTKKLTAVAATLHAEKIAGRMFAHDAMATSRRAVNGALSTARATSWTAREVGVLHSHLAPVSLVVGTFSRTGKPCDATQWFTEHLTQIHLRTRPWSGGSDREKAVADALTAAVRAGKLAQSLANALAGRLHGAEFSRATGLPYHPAFARAALFETVLSADAGPHIRSAIAEHLSLDPNDKDFPAKLLEITAIFSTRYLRSDTKMVFPNMVHAWANGGAITRQMWNCLGSGENAFTLTRLREEQMDNDPLKCATQLVDQLRRRAEDGDPAARAELAVLGGDALTVAEVLSRDRGSKEDLISETPVDKKTPYRSKPPGIVAALIEIPAGRFLLGQTLVNWISQVPGHPADFSRGFTVPKVAIAMDGTPAIATTHGLPERASEWDVFALAEPGLPTRRRKEIQERRDAARRAADKSSNTPTRGTSIEALQTAIGGVQQTLRRILASSTPPGFADAAQQEELQQLLYKISLDVGKIPVVPTPVSGDPYVLSGDDD
ncbi:hypothetical protein OG894_41910 (plasmid) [Streptomyces sp. NBC_01724]|uniref:hypothetical protein n=1 Tax=Streptomyces sp. NBC_01724 TaxID=2975922 RepID=UPI002E2F59E2|nr:hypothetical protein [Streptomyces sp. NBC_01724]